MEAREEREDKVHPDLGRGVKDRPAYEPPRVIVYSEEALVVESWRTSVTLGRLASG